MVTGRFFLGLIAFLVLGFPQALAQLWLDPAYPERPALGPARAAGAVIWNHGRSLDTEDLRAPIPPYMAMLRDGGWDTFRFNRARASDMLAGSASGLVAEVHRLKQQGYRHVALAGQSFGGFVAIMAADASDEVDALVVTAPAAYGSFSQFYNSWRANATQLYPLLDQVRRARVMLFYFHADDFDPGGRGDRSRAILAARQLPYVVVDQPPQLTSHWAAASPQFAHLFGGCILDFLDAKRDSVGCPGGAFLADDTSPLRSVAPGTASAPSAESQPAALH